MPNVKNRGITQELFNSTTKILGLADFTASDSAQTIDVSDHDTVGGYGETMPTVKFWKGSGKLWQLRDSVTFVLETSQAALYTAYLNNTVLTIEYRPGGTGAGKAKTTVSARVSKFDQSFATAGAQDITFELEGVGAPVVSTQ